jgi:glycosyltransferase involved in cell wall biosynthesis
MSVVSRQTVLYTTSARLGGTGLDVSSHQGALASHRAGMLARVIAYANAQDEIPRDRVRSLAWHPVRACSGLGSGHYYGAKKHYLDWIAARAVRSGRYDAVHSWSGDCLHTLIAARQRDIPSVIDIPTWHRNKGHIKPFVTKSERLGASLRGWQAWKHGLLVSRQQMLLEYELATLLLMPSTCSADTFRAVGIPESRLHYVGRGVDLARYTPGSPPSLFRLIFVGALIRRKGIVELLEAWKKLALRDAELVLVGEPHPEVHEALRAAASDSIRVVGFTSDVPAQLRTASAFVFPSECEGFAKATLEAAACGLPLIATRESGDALVDGVTGFQVPARDAAALADVISHAYHHPEKLAPMAAAARQRVAENFTWDHYRARILAAYAKLGVGPPLGPTG